VVLNELTYTQKICKAYFFALYSWKALVIGQWMKLQLKKQSLVSLFKLEKGGDLCPLFASVSRFYPVFNMTQLCYYGSLQKKWGMTCTATEDDVDVLMSGYAFRLKLLHERALSLSMAYFS
jgi:hypothetical protein